MENDNPDDWNDCFPLSFSLLLHEKELEKEIALL